MRASVCLRKSTGSHQKVKSMCLGEIGTRATFFRSQLEQRQLLHDRIKCLRKTRSCDEIAFLALAKEKKATNKHKQITGHLFALCCELHENNEHDFAKFR